MSYAVLAKGGTLEATELKTWIADRVNAGESREQVYLALLQAGHTVEAIEEAYQASAAGANGADLQQRVIRIVLVVGAILVGAGVFSFIAANWAAMADWLRIAVIVAGMAVFSTVGIIVRERTGSRLTGETLLLIGSIIFGAGVFLVAQIYNVQGNWPDGFMLWMLGALAMAVAVRSRGVLVLGLVVGFVAAVGYPASLLSEGAFDPYVLTSPVLALCGAAAAIGSGLWIRAGTNLGPEERW
jgi:uncharacterized membrane protein